MGWGLAHKNPGFSVFSWGGGVDQFSRIVQYLSFANNKLQLISQEVGISVAMQVGKSLALISRLKDKAVHRTTFSA